MKKIYLAGGFFDPEQIEVAEHIEQICRDRNLPFFSPRLECFCPPDATPEQRRKTFQMNIENIESAAFVFARIDDFDSGTMWELGYAFRSRIKCYAYTVFEDRGLNLMLAESGMKLVQGWERIEKFLSGDSSVADIWNKEII